MASSAKAEVVTVGAADNTDCLPFGCAGASFVTEYQQVYSASSFGALPFDIAAVSFFRALDPNPAMLTSATYTIGFSTTAAAVGALDPSLILNLGFDNQVFFSGVLGGSVGSELTIGGNGSTPTFLYNPMAGNLLMDITISGAGPDTGIFFDTEQPSSVTSSAAPGIADPENLGLVTQFSTTPPPPPHNPVPEPSTLLLLATALMSAALAKRRRPIE